MLEFGHKTILQNNYVGFGELENFIQQFPEIPRSPQLRLNWNDYIHNQVPAYSKQYASLTLLTSSDRISSSWLSTSALLLTLVVRNSFYFLPKTTRVEIKFIFYNDVDYYNVG